MRLVKDENISDKKVRGKIGERLHPSISVSRREARRIEERSVSAPLWKQILMESYNRVPFLFIPEDNRFS